MTLDQAKQAAKAADTPRNLIGKAVHLGRMAARLAPSRTYAHEDHLSQLHRAMAATPGLTAGQHRALYAVFEAAFDHVK